MAPESTGNQSESEVMASHDEGSDAFVIADIARDDAWMSVEATDAPVLADWA